MSNLMKTFHWEPSYSMQTDKTKLLVAFRNFANAPKNACTFCFHGKDIKSYKLLLGAIRRKQLT